MSMKIAGQHVKKGDTFNSWFTGTEPDKSSRVLDILPYTGRYPDFFNCVLVLSAEHPRSGKVEQAYQNP